MSRSSRKEEVGETSQHEGGRSIEDSSDSSLDTDAVDPRLKQMPYIEAFGHRYHASGKIFLPFDKNELERMEIQHKLYRHCLDGALTSTRLPLHTTQILDLGTGTGVWAIEMAARYPQAQITGVDVYPIQRRGGIPPNVKFEIYDAEDPWSYPDNTFDFIHARSMAGGVRNWPALFRQVYNKLKPGGLFEMTEIALNIFDFDGKFAEAEMCPEFLQICRDLYKEVDMDFNPSPLVPDWLVEIDFEKVVQRSEILPLGSWAQDEKMKTRQNLVNKITNEDYCTLDNHCGLLFHKGGWTKAEYDARMPPFWQEIYSGEIRPYIRAVFTTARKPREEGPS